MVDQARQNESVGGQMLTEAGARDYLYRLFQQRGINPANNIWARQIMNRANEAAYLMNVMGVQDAQAPQFLQNWMAGRTGQGDANYGGTAMSRGGISNFVNQAMQTNDPNSWQYKFFNTGDPDQDIENLRAAQGLQYGGYARGVQQAQQNVLGDWYQQARSGMQANPNASTNVMDWWLRRSPPPMGGVAPPPGTPPAGTPQAGTPQAGTPPTGAPPPAMTPQPGQPPAGAPPAYNPNPVTGQPPQPYGGWADLLNKYRPDERNWGTQGYRPNPGQFTIGGFTYDPNQDLVRDWTGMGGKDSGGMTQRGNFMGQFMKYLQLLMQQRAGVGNAALGITRNTTDDQLARIAADRMGRHAVGSSGMTIRTG